MAERGHWRATGIACSWAFHLKSKKFPLNFFPPLAAASLQGQLEHLQAEHADVVNQLLRAQHAVACTSKQSSQCQSGSLASDTTTKQQSVALEAAFVQGAQQAAHQMQAHFETERNSLLSQLRSLSHAQIGESEDDAPVGEALVVMEDQEEEEHLEVPVSRQPDNSVPPGAPMAKTSVIQASPFAVVQSGGLLPAWSRAPSRRAASEPRSREASQSMHHCYSSLSNGLSSCALPAVEESPARDGPALSPESPTCVALQPIRLDQLEAAAKVMLSICIQNLARTV